MTTMKTCSVSDKNFSKYYNYKSHIQRFHNSQEPGNKILYCYSIYQDTFDRMKREVEGIEFLAGIPIRGEVENFADGMHNLMILDDLSEGMVKDHDMERLFVQGAHHSNLSVFLVSHNYFRQGKCARTVALNTHYTVL